MISIQRTSPNSNLPPDGPLVFLGEGADLERARRVAAEGTVLLRNNGLSAIQIVAQKTIDNGLDSIVIVAGRPAAT